MGVWLTSIFNTKYSIAVVEASDPSAMGSRIGHTQIPLLESTRACIPDADRPPFPCVNFSRTKEKIKQDLEREKTYKERFEKNMDYMRRKKLSFHSQHFCTKKWLHIAINVGLYKLEFPLLPSTIITVVFVCSNGLD